MTRLRSFLIAVLSAPSVLLLACGGRVGGIPGTGNPDSGSDGHSTVTPGCPAPDQVVAGGVCPLVGLACSGPTTQTCCGPDTSQCTCENTGWSCVYQGPTCQCPPPPPPPTCPDPSAVVAGQSCNVPSYLSCTRELPPCGGLSTCNCQNGTWECEGPDCSAPLPCPPPDQTVAGAPCMSPQLQCPGDPTTCDGNVFYDSMQCTYDGSAWRWSVLAETICGDGGPQDASVPEVGIGAE